MHTSERCQVQMDDSAWRIAPRERGREVGARVPSRDRGAGGLGSRRVHGESSCHEGLRRWSVGARG
eukprot:9087429-Pyramimonas_sp.AAC.1